MCSPTSAADQVRVCKQRALQRLSAACVRACVTCRAQIQKSLQVTVQNNVLWCDNAVVKVLFCLGIKATWMGLGKDHGLG